LRKRLVWLLAGVAAVVTATEGRAQTKLPAAKPPAAPTRSGSTVEGVTVTGESPQAYRSSIDRRSYGVATDLRSTTGSIGDALRNIPSVEVDVQGNVSLRGDATVTIMIDGKPSGQFRGEGKGQALQNLPADQIERVEVITNPSAAFKPDGAAGIINLITKKSRKPGGSGSVRVNVGTGDRHNAGASGSYNSNRITVSADVGLRHDTQKTSSVDERERLNPATGAFISSRQQFQSLNTVDFRNLRTSVDYDPDARTRISGELRYNRLVVDSPSSNSFGEPDNFTPLTAAFTRDGAFRLERSNAEASATYRYKFAPYDHELVVNLSRERTADDRDGRFDTVIRLPVPAATFENIRSRIIQNETQFKADYSRPLPGEAKLKVGYELEVQDNNYNDFGFRGPTAAGAKPDPSLNNRFLYEQTIHAAYVTYEKAVGDLTLLGGLRLEEVLIDTNQLTTATQDSRDEFSAYPTLHLAYKLSDEQQLTASYSHRVQRPQPQDLNPFRIYQGPLSFREGNPRLDPQETHSLEAGYQYRKNGTFYLATLYYRQTYNGAVDVVRDIGGGILLYRRENLGESRAGGLELVANGKLNPKLSYNVSGNLFWNELDTASLGLAGTRSGFSIGGRANLNWTMTDNDFAQVNATMHGRRLTPQGHTKANAMLNLGYRHKFDDRLSAVVTVQDLLGSFKSVSITDTPALRSRQVFTPRFRSVFVGLTYSFGSDGRKPRDPGFEFGGGGTPG
jgi:outer membrane receptor protein involved in Fe transport